MKDLTQEQISAWQIELDNKKKLQHDRLTKSTSRIDTHKNIVEILGFIGLVLSGCIIGIGMAFGCLILAPLTIALIVVAALPLALLSSSIFAKLYCFVTKDTFEKDEQDIKDIKQDLINIDEKQRYLDKIKRRESDIALGKAVDSLPATKASPTTSNRSPAGEEQTSVNHNSFFNQQSSDSNGADSAEPQATTSFAP